jgi:hexosaminidase
MKLIPIFVLALTISALALAADPPAVTPLWARGHAVIPTPQRITLTPAEVHFDGTWTLTSSVPAEHIAVRSLTADLRSFHALELAKSASNKTLALSIQKGTVAVPGDPELAPQAYRLNISSNKIEITGNADAGLFYGVQTFIQLLKQGPRGVLILPEGTIEDWPDLQLRFLHWDTKNHQDRMETLKRYLDWTARFKANMIGFEFGDRFEFPSLPEVGIPGAFTTAQIQELTAYAAERFIQLVPVIQAPSHLAYVLKHPRYAHLKADNNNYQAVLCNPETDKLIFQLYDDVIRATPGVNYLFVSTDEIYYASTGCPGENNADNRSRQWAEFARRAADYLAPKNRRMLAWLEYPLLAKHLELIPASVIDGVIGSQSYLPIENKRGMRQLGYVSMQGSEFFFPDYLPLERDLRDPAAATDDYDPLEFERGLSTGRIQSVLNSIETGTFRKGKPIGVFGAAWDDSGLHNETFWLGWSAAARYAWHSATPSPEQHVTEFMQVYYGPRVSGLPEIYRAMQRQSRTWQRTWDRVISRVRGPGYGNSDGKGIGTQRHDLTLAAPPLPTLPHLEVRPRFTRDYRRYLEQAQLRMPENDRLIHALQETIGKADRNAYNLEVYLAIAKFVGHHWNLLLHLSEAENALEKAQAAAARNRPKDAVTQLHNAYRTVAAAQKEGAETFRRLTETFERSQYPKGRTVDGKKYMQVLDDTKDHWAARTADSGFMYEPERSMGLDRWKSDLRAILESYAKTHQVKLPPVDGEEVEQ